MDKLKLSNLHHKEHQKWLSQLDFYQDEIKIFQNELVTALHRHPNFLSIAEHVEEYRSIFLKKLGHIDEYRHRIIYLEKHLSQHLDPNPENLWDHETLRNHVSEFVSDFEKLKANFRRFVSRNQ